MPLTLILRPSRSILTSDAPTTQGTPNWRATTAAWLVAPPSLVRMPLAASMPCTSSGLVKGRTMITACFSSLAFCSAVSASKYTRPTAAPGDALTPLARKRPSCLASRLFSSSNSGCNRVSTWSGVTRITASSLLMMPSLAMSTAILIAALAVRLPLRVCNIHSFLFSMVNSTSCMSL